MDVGFETIGNATLICHDNGPVLVTDPWVTGSAYFGSWARSHEIPDAQMQSILGTQFVWISHGHPDHLEGASLERLRQKIILVPDAVGGRVREDLTGLGFHVRVLPDRTWIPLSPRIRVLSIADCNQDAVLLVDINGRLVVNMNDASDRGWGRFVQRQIARYPISFLLRLSGFGDADMINVYDDDGRFLDPAATPREPVGRQIGRLLDEYGARYFIPFSSMHRYQRQDSVWANRYTTRIDDYKLGFASRRGELLPPFLRYDCERDVIEEIHPPESAPASYAPEEFGDRWSDPLERDDLEAATRYFQSISHLTESFDFINLRVGGRDHGIPLSKRKLDRGITFEVPRNSLMIAVREQVFDDLLIGNFMKTTLHGRRRSKAGLYPDFTPYVAKYADNGRARTRAELESYFERYRARAPLDFVRFQIEDMSKNTLRRLVPAGGITYRLARTGYHAWRALG